MMTVNRNPSPRELRQFGLAMLLGFGLLGVVLWCSESWGWAGGPRQRTALMFWGLGVLLCACSLAPRGLSVPVYVIWMTGALWIGKIVTPVMLTIVFVLLLPIFSLIRLGDPLRLRLKPESESYWEDHQHHDSTLERTKRPF